jgi:hypothetical protein
MTQIQIDPALQHQLSGMVEPIAFCDPSGKVLGHYIPEAEYKRMLYASFKVPYSDEEIARRRAETGGSSLQEIWKELGQE